MWCDWGVTLIDHIVLQLMLCLHFYCLHRTLSKNSQIPRFSKVCDNLSLFRKYLAIYHFFGTRVSQTQVPSESANVALAKLDFLGIKKCHLVLEFLKIKYCVSWTRVLWTQVLCNFSYTVLEFPKHKYGSGIVVPRSKLILEFIEFVFGSGCKPTILEFIELE